MKKQASSIKEVGKVHGFNVVLEPDENGSFYLAIDNILYFKKEDGTTVASFYHKDRIDVIMRLKCGAIVSISKTLILMNRDDRTIMILKFSTQEDISGLSQLDDKTIVISSIIGDIIVVNIETGTMRSINFWYRIDKLLLIDGTTFAAVNSYTGKIFIIDKRHLMCFCLVEIPLSIRVRDIIVASDKSLICVTDDNSIRRLNIPVINTVLSVWYTVLALFVQCTFGLMGPDLRIDLLERILKPQTDLKSSVLLHTVNGNIQWAKETKMDKVLLCHTLDNQILHQFTLLDVNTGELTILCNSHRFLPFSIYVSTETFISLRLDNQKLVLVSSESGEILQELPGKSDQIMQVWNCHGDNSLLYVQQYNDSIMRWMLH